MHIIILTKFQKNCSKFQNCDLRKFHDLPKIRNFCPPENVKLFSLTKVSIFLMTDPEYVFDEVSKQIVLTKISL